MADFPNCPDCCSANLIETSEGVPPPHHAKLVCGDCGRWIKWLAGPASEYRLRLKKHQGKTLAEIVAVDRPYLEWIAANPKFRDEKIRAKVQEFLKENPAPLRPEWGWQHPDSTYQRRQEQQRRTQEDRQS